MYLFGIEIAMRENKCDRVRPLDIGVTKNDAFDFLHNILFNENSKMLPRNTMSNTL